MINGVLFLDLKKVFDTVDHDILLSLTFTWFHPYLANRQQMCCVNRVVSTDKTITCGVLQGSILGPLLFLIYVNDMPNCLDYGVARLFADNTNLTFASRTLPVLQDKMSKDLGQKTAWPNVNKLIVNLLKKFHVSQV